MRAIACLLVLAAFVASRSYADPEPTTAQGWVNKGVAINDNSDAEAACYRKAIGLDPQNASAHFNLGYVLHGQKEYASALDEYRRCLECDPERLDALLNAGKLALVAERDREEARWCYNRFVELAAHKAGADPETVKEAAKDVGTLEEEIAAQKGCTFQEFYTAADIVRILTKSITRTRGGGNLYSAGRVPIMLFEAGESDLTEAARRQLDQAALALQDEAVREIRIVIEGHADSKGDSEANTSLSRRRAGAIARYLAECRHVPGDRLIVRWYGEDRPVDRNAPPEGRRHNRRIEINNEAACW